LAATNTSTETSMLQPLKLLPTRCTLLLLLEHSSTVITPSSTENL
jgi:hypothetical protein